ncbi:VOC family protein [Methylopila sp. M107]|uniref:bleomycin resistance protein n=1 Tax=Methylopila sp. M107 TaxID=1101190 RepID=UPI0003689765|nr:VOC family protein [Methylopila sp. M107]
MTGVGRPRLVPELAVSDLAASLLFWTKLAAFSVAFERPEEGFALIERAGARLMLEQRDRATRTWETADLEAPFGRGVNFEIDVDDVDAILARFLSTGWPLFMAPEEKWYRQGATEVGVRQFLAQDPDGYLVRFSQRIVSKAIGAL